LAYRFTSSKEPEGDSKRTLTIGLSQQFLMFQGPSQNKSSYEECGCCGLVNYFRIRSIS
jgi:hypothetical protein